MCDISNIMYHLKYNTCPPQYIGLKTEITPETTRQRHGCKVETLKIKSIFHSMSQKQDFDTTVSLLN